MKKWWPEWPVSAGELTASLRADAPSEPIRLVVRANKLAPPWTTASSELKLSAGIAPGCAVAVSHRPEDVAGEQLLVFAERRRDTPASDDLIETCRRAVLTATGLAPHRVVVLEAGAIPRTSSGKLRRAETLSRYLAGELDA